MNSRARIACWAGDVAHWGLVNVLRRNGGNIPGALALRVDPALIGSLAAGLDRSVMITGTNGKTTTTGLIADAIAAGGERVVCNRAGNNMESGIAAALLQGRRESPQVGCLECDELYTVRVLPRVRPRALVLLNLFRDQLDRYGEIDHTQDVIAQALATSPETLLVYNADDPLCAAIADRVPNRGVPLGVDEPTGLEADRVSDSRFCARCNAPLDYAYVHYGQLGSYRCPSCGWGRPQLAFAVRNVELGRDGYSFDVEDRRADALVTHHLSCRYNGLYMVYNIAAAFAAALVMGTDAQRFQGVLDAYRPASGRGRTFSVGGRDVVSNLAKNPTGFDRMLQEIKTENGQLMAFFLNDKDADGHDVSWIWDVDFERLGDLPDLEHIFVGGTRAHDLAVRLKYADLPAQPVVIQNLEDALRQCADQPLERTLHVVANYTAFPPVVAELGRLEKNFAPATSGAEASVQASAGTRSDAAPLPAPLALDHPLRIVHLYPDALNLYGDGGNIASLQKRCAWRDIPVDVDQVLMGQELDLFDADVVLLGGGSDRDQLAVAHELRGQREKLASYVADGGALLAICGGYQLLGTSYQMGDENIEGLGILDLVTTAASTRLIGNMAVNSSLCAEPIVGFENHAGRTVLGASETPLGVSLVPGTGNNGEDGGEGILHKGVVGTYLHGPILPKNPGVTDWLIAHALRRRGLAVELAPLDDTAEKAAHNVALKIARRK